METIILEKKYIQMTDDDLLEFCAQHKELQIERDANQNIIIMAPVASNFDNYNLDITSQLFNWNKKSKAGYAYGPTAGFLLPNGAMRSPDAAWMSHELRNTKSKEAGRKFLELCPEFIIELMSPSDQLKTASDKMNEWIANGCKLGWLIYPDEKKVFIYRPDKDVAEKSFTEKMSGEDVLAGFELDLSFMME